MKVGTVTAPLLNGIAGKLEQLGFDAVLLSDSQNRAPEVWTALGAASCETSTALLGPGITNTVTRDPAVIAAAATTLQMLSAGRAILPIGRGDSAAMFCGSQPAKVAEFELAAQQIRDYLHHFNADRAGYQSNMDWLAIAAEHGPVPIEIIPSGPRMTEVAARTADRISFAVGADPEYIAQFRDHAKQAALDAGRDPAKLKFGVWLNVVVHPDRAVALEAVRSSTGVWARFSTHRKDKHNLPKPLRDVVEHLKNYDKTQWAQQGATTEAMMPTEFVDWFAIAGNVDYCRERLKKIAALDLDYCYIVPGNLGFADAVGEASIRSFAKDLLPGLQGSY